MSEQPAASLNWTHSQDGLPIGIQIIGRRFDDLGVLRFSSDAGADAAGTEGLAVSLTT